MTRPHEWIASMVTAFALVACSHGRTAQSTDASSAPAATLHVAEAPVTAAPVVAAREHEVPAQAFLDRLARHEGQSFAGRVIANVPATDDDPFEGRELVMHVRECLEGEVRIPFHVGDDHSRTWILRRVGDRLELKHDHRHEDGSPDVLTFYGGTSATAGSALRQEFPVDQESRSLFERERRLVSLVNTWAMEIEPGERFLYELSRPTGRLFQVEFDLTRTVSTPPVPWGHE